MSESVGKTSSSSKVARGGFSVLSVIVAFVIIWEGYKISNSKKAANS